MKHIKYTLLCSALLVAVNLHAEEPTVWRDSAGHVVVDGSGNCLRTIYWTPDSTCPGRDAGAAAPASAVTTAGDIARPAAAPVVSSRTPVRTTTAPKYREISLASGASFEAGGSDLSAAGKQAVRELLAKFSGESIKQVIVEGHTDDRGAAVFNQQLSEKRANAVKAEMVAQGVAATMIETVGYGEDRPVAENASREGRALNRRVEIKIDAAKREF